MPADEVDRRKFGPPEVIDDKGLIIEWGLEGRYLRLDRCVKEELEVCEAGAAFLGPFALLT
jgi:hypothetical protein